MIKIDDHYSIVGIEYGFALQRHSEKDHVRTVGYFSDLGSALEGYARRETVRAVGGEETETSLEAVAEALEWIAEAIEQVNKVLKEKGEG